jgi:hypothetical protein
LVNIDDLIFTLKVIVILEVARCSLVGFEEEIIIKADLSVTVDLEDVVLIDINLLLFWVTQAFSLG